jgi:hypothetical protein
VDLSRLRWNQSFSHGEELNADGESGKPRISVAILLRQLAGGIAIST